MADFPAQAQEYNRVTITTASVESVGVEAVTAGFIFTSTAAWPAANQAIFVPFVVYTTLTAVKMFVANGATVSGNIDVGIFDTGGHRLVSAGSSAQAGTSGLQVFDVTDTTLQPGSYYFGVAMDNTTGTLTSAAPAVGICSAFGLLSQASAFALPDPVTFAAAASAYVPLVGLTARTVI